MLYWKSPRPRNASTVPAFSAAATEAPLRPESDAGSVVRTPFMSPTAATCTVRPRAPPSGRPRGLARSGAPGPPEQPATRTKAAASSTPDDLIATSATGQDGWSREQGTPRLLSRDDAVTRPPREWFSSGGDRSAPPPACEGRRMTETTVARGGRGGHRARGRGRGAAVSRPGGREDETASPHRAAAIGRPESVAAPAASPAGTGGGAGPGPGRRAARTAGPRAGAVADE